MLIEQLYTNCLAEAAYYIESEGEAIIIDPIRETKPYLEKLKERKAKLKYVFETHFHADFVSGHIDLARATGAMIVFGPGAETNYEVYNAKDGEEFKLGKIRMRVLHTPGHTPESSCYLLFDENGNENAIFTGDTLFVGDVGRPDLLDGTMTKEELASMMYDSLNNKIKVLPDHVIMYPAHGPGSACGKHIGKETWSTIGEQKKHNHALLYKDKASFVASVTAGLSPPPQYFFKDAMINKNGYDDVEKVMKKNLRPLDAATFSKEMKNGAFVLDTRPPDLFEKGFIAGAMNIGLNGQFAIWAGTLLDINTPLLLLTEKGKEEESVIRLARVGYENIKGYLDGGIETWKNSGNKMDAVRSITPEEFAKLVNAGNAAVLDVRRDGEFHNSCVRDAEHFSLDDLRNTFRSLDKKKTYLIHCAGGYRSMIAASILKAQGFTNLVNVYGGFNKIKETNAPIVVPVTT